MALPDLPSGIYRHYKGHHYVVLGYAHDSNQDGRIVVVYAGLELEGATPGHPRLNVRTVDDFFASVDGKPRFTYVGTTWDKG
ncbi:MAG: hypothetical protein K0S68_604 [Candidatus Saccharibacteria bacterium]|jgi:hypothetical protein|nr:hypothetical protein [Candidatus Saccharibacteria bacterium]